MERHEITDARKDEIIEGLLQEYMEGITQDGLDCLRNIMEPEELQAYGFDLSEIEPEC